MPKRKTEPEEAIGPVLDGLMEPLTPLMPPEPEPESQEEEIEIIEHPVVLICGYGLPVSTLGMLAENCGFIVEYALLEDDPAPVGASEDQIHRLEDFDNFVDDCGIDHNYFVCVFVDSPPQCVNILQQCLASEARYLGLFADTQMKADVYDALKSLGAPDAELAALRCPIGLNIGATTPDQLAVAIVAELMATRNGTMNRLLADR